MKTDKMLKRVVAQMLVLCMMLAMLCPVLAEDMADTAPIITEGPAEESLSDPLPDAGGPDAGEESAPAGEASDGPQEPAPAETPAAEQTDAQAPAEPDDAPAPAETQEDTAV